MSKNSAKDGVIELGGGEFRRVKNGLDEAQVVSFINGLISQRDMFMQHEKHLSSFTKLAEKTVTEADKLAEEIKTEAIDRSKAEASAIVAKAEEQAQQMIDEKRTEITNIANEEAAAIKAEAERKAALLLENQRKTIQTELGNFVRRICSQLLSEFEGLKQQIVALEVDLEHKLSQPAEGTSTVTIEEDERDNEFLELIQTGDQTNTGEPDWELEILPPTDIMKMMRVVTHLDGLPEVEKTEIIPDIDKPLIMVFLREPIHLIDILKTLPDVEEVKEDTEEEFIASADTAQAEGKRKKIQVKLTKGKTVLDETRERLDNEVPNILSSSSDFHSPSS